MLELEQRNADSLAVGYIEPAAACGVPVPDFSVPIQLN